MSKSAPSLPLKVATKRASAELEELNARLERFENGLDSVIVQARHDFDSASIGMLQELDMLRQSISALADFLAQISIETDEAGMVDVAQALSGLPLRDMASRLSGAGHATAASGHTELF